MRRSFGAMPRRSLLRATDPAECSPGRRARQSEWPGRCARRYRLQLYRRKPSSPDLKGAIKPIIVAAKLAIDLSARAFPMRLEADHLGATRNAQLMKLPWLPH